MTQLTHDQLLLLWNIDVLCQRCVRLAHYFDVVSGAKKSVWKFTQNSYGELCVIYWCKVFGGKREPSHYTRLFLAGSLAGVTEACARQRLHNSAGLSAAKYDAFWKEVKTARDKYMVHNEFNTTERVVFPDLEMMAKVCHEMREVVREIITNTKAANHGDQDLHRNIEEFVSMHDTLNFSHTIQKESRDLVKATK